MKIIIEREINLKPEEIELLMSLKDQTILEYKDPEYPSLEDFKTKNIYFKNEGTGYQTADWFLRRNENGTFMTAVSLYDLQLLEDVENSWYQTFRLSKLGKLIKEKLGSHVPRQGDVDLQSTCGEFDTFRVHMNL